MYHPKKYEDHEQSLKKFVDLFNKQSDGRICMSIHKEENFRDDGVISDKKTGKQIPFDWEKRHSYYNTFGFPFDSFGQFERKILKPEVILSIQCSKDESAFCIAWHSDFLKEEMKKIDSIKENGSYENKGKRFTRKFKEYSYKDIGHFNNSLKQAFDKNKFNYEVLK